ncbi:MAG: lipoyl protein ligase domain-containing protein, partial [Anaerolineales bacterium]
MDCYFLDKISWQHSQGLYHAAAHLGREALFVLRPSTPYICIGYHQDAEQEIDLDYSGSHQIPVFRREVGGGSVYLDGGQLFYQLVLR